MCRTMKLGELVNQLELFIHQVFLLHILFNGPIQSEIINIKFETTGINFAG